MSSLRLSLNAGLKAGNSLFTMCGMKDLWWEKQFPRELQDLVNAHKSSVVI